MRDIIVLGLISAVLLLMFNTIGNPKYQGKFKKHNKKKTIESSSTFDISQIFKNLEAITNNMLVYKDNKFSMILEIDPANFYLLSDTEKKAVINNIEGYIGSVDYNFRTYVQTRYIDLKDHIKNMEEVSQNTKNLSDSAKIYASEVIEDTVEWLNVIPRYKTFRFIIFPLILDIQNITADSQEELELKIREKAFSELARRVSHAENSLKKAKISVRVLLKEDLLELQYITLNREKSKHMRFKDKLDAGNFSLYSTRDTQAADVSLVQENIRNIQKMEATNDIQ